MNEEKVVQVGPHGELSGPIPVPQPGESIAGAWHRQRREARGSHCQRRRIGCRNQRCACVCSGCKAETVKA